MGAWVPVLLLVAGLVQGACAAWRYVAALRDLADAMGASIGFDWRWMEASVFVGLGLALGPVGSWAALPVTMVLAYGTILPLKAGLRRLLGR